MSVAQAQTGGQAHFEFLNVPVTARQTALGGINVSANDRDPAMFLANPALLSDSTHHWLSTNYQAWHAGISQVAAAYTRRIGKHHYGFAAQRMGYGTLQGFDPAGNPTGTFNASDMAVTFSHARRKDNFRLGANMRFVQSTLDTYQAQAITFDMGAAFVHPTRDLKIGLTARNAGFGLRSYAGERMVMPFDLQLGATFKPDKMPFRFSLTAHHLYQGDIAYNDPTRRDRRDALGNPVQTSISTTDKVMRHVVIGVEWLLSKHLHARFGYNFLQRRELTVEQRRSTVGLSWGLVVRTRRWELAYSRSAMHLSGGVNMVTFALDMQTIIP